MLLNKTMKAMETLPPTARAYSISHRRGTSEPLRHLIGTHHPSSGILRPANHPGLLLRSTTFNADSGSQSPVISAHRRQLLEKYNRHRYTDSPHTSKLREFIDEVVASPKLSQYVDRTTKAVLARLESKSTQPLAKLATQAEAPTNPLRMEKDCVQAANVSKFRAKRQRPYIKIVPSTDYAPRKRNYSEFLQSHSFFLFDKYPIDQFDSSLYRSKAR